MPRHWERSKEATTPPPPRISSKIHSNIENRPLRNPGRMTSKSRNRRSSTRSSRRSRSPRHKKSLTPKRRVPIREKRTTARSTREDTRPSQKRPRGSSRNRSKSPPPRRISRERPHSYSDGKEAGSDKQRGSTQIVNTNSRDDVGDRFHSGDKYVVDRPMFRGPEKDVLHDRDDFKKIVVNMRDIPPGNDSIKRNVVNPDDMSVVRRAVSARGSRDYREMDNGRMSRSLKYDISPPLWTQRSYPYGRGVNHEEPARYPSEGSRPIFDREEIINNRLKYDDDQRERRRVMASSPVHTDRRHFETNSSNDNMRSRDGYYEEERHPRRRDYPNLRPSPREYESRTYEKPREERSRDDLRYPPPSSRARSRSYERSREYQPDRKERYDERDSHRTFRRSPDRGRPDERLIRRHPSPGDSRRHFDDYRIVDDRRERSLERRDIEPTHFRDHEFAPSDRFSSADYMPKSQAYYESESRENLLSSPPRGRGRALSFRGRGLPSSRPFARSTEPIIRPVPPVRPVRASFIPRGPGTGRRLPFPPRKSFRGSFDARH